mmetsp:Transcript_4423/g.11132  ORF Transcript_4423/g.11132 Transcript_4423/m.11132 type:complete len:287 (-) Transcript_4423:74-934(-)
MDARVGHQVRLEFCDVNVQRAVETQRRCERRDDLREEPVEVRVRRPLDVQVSPANVVERLVVHHDRHVRVLEERVHAKHRVVGFNDCRRHLRTSPDRETQLRLFTIIHRKTLQHEATKAGAGASAAGVEDHEALQPRAVVRKLSEAIEHEVNDFLPDGIVPAGKVVRGVLLTADQLFWVEELAVRPRAHLVDHRWLQVHHHAAGDMLPRAGLREEGIERVIATADGLVAGHLSIWLDAVFEAEELPASVPDLHTRLTDVDADGLAHGDGGGKRGGCVADDSLQKQQ